MGFLLKPKLRQTMHPPGNQHPEGIHLRSGKSPLCPGAFRGSGGESACARGKALTPGQGGDDSPGLSVIHYRVVPIALVLFQKEGYRHQLVWHLHGNFDRFGAKKPRPRRSRTAGSGSKQSPPHGFQPRAKSRVATLRARA